MGKKVPTELRDDIDEIAEWREIEVPELQSGPPSSPSRAKLMRCDMICKQMMRCGALECEAPV